MSSHYEAPIREPLVTGEKTYHDISVEVGAPVLGRANKSWYIVFTIALIAFLWGLGCIIYTVSTGIGVWGLNKTIGWAWDITNFVWWVGIGHAGTLISAVLLLFRQKWRMAVNRSAEAMTIFAVVQAGLFPIIHMGRPWLAYWVLPIPNQFGSLWVNFNSPLLWDVFAISTYLSVSLVFWWTGLLPDFAMLRDRTTNEFQKKIYGILSFGWSGRVKDWQRFEEVSLVLAGLATPLVLSVHTIVSFDFATSVVPGWHSTIFPPYFVAGAIFSGFAMVQTLLIIMRKVVNLQDYITLLHIEYMNKVILLTGGIVSVAYITEFFIGWYSGTSYENYTYLSFGAATGPYAWAFWALIVCNFVVPLTLWVKKLRRNILWTFIVALVINIGMWFERFDIIVIDLSKGRTPSSWAMFSPTFVDIGVFIGTIGFFFVLFLLYARTFPVIAQAEVKTILKSSGEYYKNLRAKHGDDVAHHVDNDPTAKEPSANIDDKKDFFGDTSTEKEPGSGHESTVNADALGVTEAQKDRLDAMLARIGTYNPKVESADELQKLNGVGPLLEQHLHQVGIYKYDQVANLTKDDYKLLDEVIENFPIIENRGDWNAQATELKNK
ncbi:NrfD/PsrC family molybdoenzyme membrane anchor subunit [Zunongwangia profunda]|uniref:NrfD/PsrC family molybdoenzyme membrane anchor subunit n=1 Tax=Zunongwangia profunda TaxID=398743 RepID=UPI000C8B5E3D|nr:NrfD/PsrC family molybdoenzyme membrane anchor subunit [Zunongwangia profunda]MAG87755.1 molybdopterin oxidoreductase [Flavobacteriaceae bacterium]MCC4227290.1 polysulfide reductase NrfD [Zunongwangia profunda]|tara:strand:- start:21227 stop:23044 length:1818 start_codon:yes stop_codon:yes gene_type:complete